MYNPQTVAYGEAARAQHGEQAPARSLTLGSAVSLNIMNMIGVGPFITLPLVAATLGPGAWMGWVLGALLAVCDGLVWAELGAAMPRAGGSYAFLREIYRPRARHRAGADAGRYLSFLYVWQLLFTAPLSIASGALGLAQYAAFLLPVLGRQLRFGFVHVQLSSLAAAAVCLLAVALLDRGIGSITRAAGVLSAGVLLTAVGVIAVAATHAHRALLIAQLHPLAGLHGSGLFGKGLLPALGAATLITTYDYWGYYNVCFLGAEVRDPGRTIPRAVLVSIAVVACLYLLMNFTVLGALPVSQLVSSTGAARPMASVLMRAVLPGAAGTLAATVATLLIVWTAFASVVALLLGYSRAPYAAAREGNFFAPFARVHPRYGFPSFSLFALGGIAACCCFFQLRTVIAALVAVRIVLQYALQQAGLIVLRVRRPRMRRPFRVWLYPLPPLAAMAGFAFLLLSRAGAVRELCFAGALAISGTVLYMWRLRTGRYRPNENAAVPK